MFKKLKEWLIELIKNYALLFLFCAAFAILVVTPLVGFIILLGALWLTIIDRDIPSNKIKVELDPGAYIPTRAHDADAGLDLYSRESTVVPAHSSAVFDTGVHIELAPNTVGFLKSKSGLNVNYGITSEGVIDVGYTGSICVKLYNNSGTDYYVGEGEKISQLVILPIKTPTPVLVDTLAVTERGDNGFGSTGRY